MEKLPVNLDHALRVIANNELIGLPAMDIKKLLAFGYIAPKHLGGWLVNSKGREYLKKHKLPVA
jgi:hypothetical protein